MGSVTEHFPTYRRRRLGTSMFGGALYGYTVICSCGWEHKTNENKRAVTQDFNDHRRAQRLPTSVKGDAQGIYVGKLSLIWQKGKHGGTAHLPRDEKDLVFPGPLCPAAGAYELVDYIGQRTIKVCSKCRRIREGGI